MNGDGYDDILIGSYYSDRNANNSGSTYVVYGKPTGFTASFDLSSLNGSNGFRIDGKVSSGLSGHSVSSAGDINGDGYDDILIGSPHGSSEYTYRNGFAHVVFGKATGFLAHLDLSSLNGKNGFKITGKGHSDNSGYAVSSAGDINGDGYDDILIGSPGANKKTGSISVIFGKANGFVAETKLSSLTGIDGFKINGKRRLSSRFCFKRRGCEWRWL